MDHRGGMNLIEAQAQVVCDREQAHALLGRVDHVDWVEDTHIARLRVDARADDRSLLAQIRGTVDRLEQALAEASIDINEGGLELAVRSEALIDDTGTWRRRGEIVPLVAFGVGA